MYHVTLVSLAERARREGLDSSRFPGRTRTVCGQATGNFLWETPEQAAAWQKRMQAEHGGRYEILTVDAEGLELERDPAIPAGSWFTAQPVSADRII